MAKELKEILSSQLGKRLSELTGCVLIDYRGLDSEQTQDLRHSLRKSGVLMNVVQNRLAQRIFQGKGAPPEFRSFLRGPTAVLFGGDGALSASKTIVQWRKKNKDLASIKGGFFQGRALSTAEVERLATLPDVATLRSTLAALFLSPATHLASAAQSLISHFASATRAHRETLEKAAPAAAAPGGG